MHFNSLECKKIDVPALSQVRQGVLFLTKCSATRNEKCLSGEKRTSCVKYAFGTIKGGILHFTSCVSTILHSSIASASLGEAKLHGILKKKTSNSIKSVK